MELEVAEALARHVDENLIEKGVPSVAEVSMPKVCPVLQQFPKRVGKCG